MPANTPRGYPYPLPAEPVANGAQAIRNLAEKIDTTTALDVIQSVALVAGGFVTFASIPQIYDDLIVRLFAKSNTTGAGGVEGLYMQCNGDTTNKYNSVTTYANVSTMTVAQLINDTGFRIGWCSAVGAAAQVWGILEAELIGYREATYKHFFSNGYAPIASGGGARFSNGGEYWGSTNPITSLTIGANNSPFTFVAGTKATLYGRRG